MVFEVVAAVLAGSLALLADAGHMLTDAGALAGALWATHLAARPATDRYSFGWKRAEILSAAVNGVTLLVVAVLVAFDAIRRLIVPPHVHGLALVVVAGRRRRRQPGGNGHPGEGRPVLAQPAGRLCPHPDRSLRLHRHAGAGCVILAFGYERADPIASLLVVA